MAYAVYLQVDTQSYQKFLQIRTALNAKVKHKQAHDLGEVLADVAVQIIRQVFVALLEQQKRRIRKPEGHKIAQDSEKVIEHVLHAIQKYLPWAIALFSNERLAPVVNYFNEMIVQQQNQIFIKYDVNDDLVAKTYATIQRVREGEKVAIPEAFWCLIEIIDLGIQQLIHHPKDMLKFNFVVDKTLNGVIQMSCHLAYKRLEGLGREVDLESAPYYIDHFLTFLNPENTTE